MSFTTSLLVYLLSSLLVSFGAHVRVGINSHSNSAVGTLMLDICILVSVRNASIPKALSIGPPRPLSSAKEPPESKTSGTCVYGLG